MERKTTRPTRAAAERRDAEVSREAIREALLSMGLDPDNPLMSQETFFGLRKMVEDYNKADAISDRAWLRARRLEAEKIANAGKIARLGAVVTFCGSLALIAVQYILKVVEAALQHNPPGQ